MFILVLLPACWYDFTIHKDEERKQRYIKIAIRIMKTGLNQALIPQDFGRAGLPTIKESYNDIKRNIWYTILI